MSRLQDREDYCTKCGDEIKGSDIYYFSKLDGWIPICGNCKKKFNKSP